MRWRDLRSGERFIGVSAARRTGCTRPCEAPGQSGPARLADPSGQADTLKGSSAHQAAWQSHQAYAAQSNTSRCERGVAGRLPPSHPPRIVRISVGRTVSGMPTTCRCPTPRGRTRCTSKVADLAHPPSLPAPWLRGADRPDLTPPGGAAPGPDAGLVPVA